MILTLYRLNEDDDGTLGAIVDGNGERICFTMENTWEDNQAFVSCIPTGDYEVAYIESSGSGKYTDCYYLQDVPGRSGILIHLGNIEDHTKGCILPGRRVGKLEGKIAVINSRGAMSRLHMETDRKSFTLKVRDSLLLRRSTQWHHG